MNPSDEALKIIEESLLELESAKGSVTSAIHKLSRAAFLIDDQEIYKWCQIQLGYDYYCFHLQNYINALLLSIKDKSDENIKKVNDCEKRLIEAGLNEKYHYNLAELNHKSDESGGGYKGIGFIEERYSDLVRLKIGNDDTYYKNNLFEHISYIKSKTHKFGTKLYNNLKYSKTSKYCFDVLRDTIDSKLLDIDAEIAEQLMVVFQSISSNKEEEWSQSLTTCRRIIKGVADKIFPPSKSDYKGRKVGKEQYINRIWCFFDKNIDSESNRELSKSHIDYFGSWIERINKISNKGVHSSISYIDAVKTVFHLYLMLADLLDFFDIKKETVDILNIHTISLDEIEAILGVNRSIAKAIIKLRVQKKNIEPEMLLEIKGIGKKTLEKAKKHFSFKKD